MIEVGQPWASINWARVDMPKDGSFVRLGGTKLEIARVAVVEPLFVCVEWVERPRHAEYGYPRQWFPRGSFVGGFLFREE